MSIAEKTAYLKGLLEGLAVDETRPEGKLLRAVVETLDEMSAAMTALEEKTETLGDYVEKLDVNLGKVEEYLCDYWDEDGDANEDCDGNCVDCAYDCDGFYEAVCPHCGETVCFDETCNPRDLICPACQERFDCLDAPEEQ